ncbi:MAG TPA: PadR family transcriptional regulator [Candidatus Eisenbacteria bacterium]|nr:PadR family transcriptional regulator [Candidatus Eisenbacteria bacterium]
MNDLLLLATLLDGPAHGYALKKRVGHITGHSDMHNNLVYPLLKRFVDAGWVSQKTVPGERGQTRERYALTSKGKEELVLRLEEFTEKDAASSEAFQLRAGLFAVLRPEARSRILELRHNWLATRITRLDNLSYRMELGEWGGEVVAFLRKQVAAERKWVGELQKKAARKKSPGCVQ